MVEIVEITMSSGRKISQAPHLRQYESEDVFTSIKAEIGRGEDPIKVMDNMRKFLTARSSVDVVAVRAGHPDLPKEKIDEYMEGLLNFSNTPPGVAQVFMDGAMVQVPISDIQTALSLKDKLQVAEDKEGGAKPLETAPTEPVQVKEETMSPGAEKNIRIRYDPKRKLSQGEISNTRTRYTNKIKEGNNDKVPFFVDAYQRYGYEGINQIPPEFFEDIWGEAVKLSNKPVLGHMPKEK